MLQLHTYYTFHFHTVDVSLEIILISTKLIFSFDYLDYGTIGPKRPSSGQLIGSMYVHIYLRIKSVFEYFFKSFYLL